MTAVLRRGEAQEVACYGSTACKAMYRGLARLEPLDHMNEI